MKRKMTTKGFVQKKSADRKPNYRVMFADVVVNPYYGTQVKYIIDLKELNDGKWLFTRYETNNTGRGMEPPTIVDDLLSAAGAGEGNKHDPKGKMGRWGLGETGTFAGLSNLELSKKYGIKVCAKKDEHKEWAYVDHDLLNKPEDDVDVTFNSDEQMKKLGVPIDEIGSQGTWIQYVIEVSRWESNSKWINTVRHYLENILMNWLPNKMDITLRVEEQNKKPYEIVLQPKLFDIEGDKWVDGEIEIHGKKYKTKQARRSKEGSDEYLDFDKKFPGRRALAADGFGKFLSIARKPVIILVDKETEYINDVSVHSGTDRIITLIYVPKDDMITETTKDGAQILNPTTENGTPAGTVSKLVNELIRTNFPELTEMSEGETMDQLYKVMRGDVFLAPLSLNMFFQDFCPTRYKLENGNNDNLKTFYKQHLELESGLAANKRGDMVIFVDFKIAEGKIKKLTSDNWHQIVSYITTNTWVKKCTILAISDLNESGAQDISASNRLGFPQKTINKFTTQIKSNLSHLYRKTDSGDEESLEEVEINLVDLRAYDLHKKIK